MPPTHDSRSESAQLAPSRFPAGADTDSAVGFVLAGGQSSRMGRDKALLELAHRPLIAHALAILNAAGLAPGIAGAHPRARVSLQAFAPVIEDATAGLGPLSGICAALAATAARYAAFLSVDQPLIPPSLLNQLLLRAQLTGSPVTLCSLAGFPQTFPAIVNRTVLPALQARLRAGQRGCFAAFQAASASLGQPVEIVPGEYLAQAGQAHHPRGLPPARWFFNLNTPADLARAQTLLTPSIA